LRILSIDPGAATGIALIECGNSLSSFVIVMREVVELWYGIEELIEQYKPDVVVMEQYRLYPNKARVQAYSTMVSPRVIGAVEEICRRLNVYLVEQPATRAKNIEVPESIYASLRKRGEDGKFPSTHEKDAIKHAVAYLYSKGL
jgi:hypothetical protein